MAATNVNAAELQQGQQQKERRKSSVRQEARAKNDKTWLETILNEQKAQKIWERKWRHLKDFQKECEDEESPFPKQRIRKEKEFKPKVEIEVEPSPSFPTTSSGLRCYKDHWIENFGPLYLSPRFTIDPPKSESPVTSDEDEEEEDAISKMKIDQRRTGLYTTSRICLR